MKMEIRQELTSVSVFVLQTTTVLRAAALFCKNNNNRDPLQKLDFEQHVKQN